MTPHALIISPIARDDLKKIYLYGGINWGKSRATRYLSHLKEQLWSLTDHPEMGIKRNELRPAIRSLTVDSHVVFYRLRSQRIEVVRVLHGRQDPRFHL